MSGVACTWEIIGCILNRSRDDVWHGHLRHGEAHLDGVPSVWSPIVKLPNWCNFPIAGLAQNADTAREASQIVGRSILLGAVAF